MEGQQVSRWQTGQQPGPAVSKEARSGFFNVVKQLRNLVVGTAAGSDLHHVRGTNATLWSLVLLISNCFVHMFHYNGVEEDVMDFSLDTPGHGGVCRLVQSQPEPGVSPLCSAYIRCIVSLGLREECYYK